MLFVAPRLFGDRSSATQRVLAAVAFVGMATVVLAGAETSGAHWSGDVYALVNLALWTVYFIRVKRVRDAGVHAGSFLAGVFLLAAVIVTPWALAVSDDLGSVDARGSSSSSPWRSWRGCSATPS